MENCMKKFAIIPNLTKENAGKVAEEVCRKLTDLGGECFFLDEHRSIFNADKAQYASYDDMLENVDAFISIGGDGTILSTAKRAAHFEKPVLGINAGRLGYMAGLEKHELDYLSNLVSGDFIIDKRMMLEVVFKEKGKLDTLYHCINDAVFARDGIINMAELEVTADDDIIREYLGDGIIVSTPTGSTAYSLAAGGPVIEPTLECITITPICTHSLFARSLIFTPDTTIGVQLTDHVPNGVNLVCDGEIVVPLNMDSKAYVKRSSLCAKLIRIKSDTFIDTLNKKLAERRA